MLIGWIVRLLLVFIFLIAFLMRSNRYWGSGLLTVSLVVLFDSLGMRELLPEMGYLGWALGGTVAAGAFIWALGVFGGRQTPATPPTVRQASTGGTDALDRQMLFEQIRDNLGPDDLLDLLFDLDLNENEMVNPAQKTTAIILNVMDEAEKRGQSGSLALAVERILTPVPSSNLPRVEKLSADSPPNLLRQYLIQRYALAELETLAERLGIDWQELGSEGKKTRVRRLLLYLKRRNRLDDLLEQMRALAAAEEPAAAANAGSRA